MEVESFIIGVITLLKFFQDKLVDSKRIKQVHNIDLLLLDHQAWDKKTNKEYNASNNEIGVTDSLARGVEMEDHYEAGMR